MVSTYVLLLDFLKHNYLFSFHTTNKSPSYLYCFLNIENKEVLTATHCPYEMTLKKK